MDSIKILANGSYLPKNKIDNNFLNNRFNLNEDWIYKRTGIKNRFYAIEESVTYMAIEAAKSAIEKVQIDVQNIGMIIVASTTTDKLMPGISFEVQKAFGIKRCICTDLLAGCSGYINAFDIVRKYIALGEIEYGLVIGVERLSKFLDEEDVNTTVLLGDGAGATLVGKSTDNKLYLSNIESDGSNGDMLTCSFDNKIEMDGKRIYKFGTTKTVENILELLEKADIDLTNIKYIVPHQSNARMLNSMCEKLGIDKSKMYNQLENIGNTFCASIPIALGEMFDKNLIKENDKLILIGYGGGLNLGSILLEV